MPTEAPAVTQRAPRQLILVAEDDRALRRLVADHLRRAGLEVVEARDGAEALARIAAGPTDGAAVDLIISDVRMPGQGGLQLLAALRALGCTIPVLLITAFGSAETHETARRWGALAVLDKPFDLDELVGAVRRCLPA